MTARMRLPTISTTVTIGSTAAISNVIAAINITITNVFEDDAETRKILRNNANNAMISFRNKQMSLCLWLLLSFSLFLWAWLCFFLRVCTRSVKNKIKPFHKSTSSRQSTSFTVLRKFRFLRCTKIWSSTEYIRLYCCWVNTTEQNLEDEKTKVTALHDRIYYGICRIFRSK